MLRTTAPEVILKYFCSSIPIDRNYREFFQLLHVPKIYHKILLLSNQSHDQEKTMFGRKSGELDVLLQLIMP